MEPELKVLKLENDNKVSKNKVKVLRFECQCNFDRDVHIKSTEVIFEEIPGINFWVEFFIRTYEISSSIQVYKNNKKKSIATVSIEVIGNVNTRTTIKWDDYVEFNYDNLKLINFDEVENNIQDSKMTFNCTIYWYGFIEDFYHLGTCPLIDYFYKIQEFSDIYMVIKNDKSEYPVHKIVIATHSPVFYKMLTSDMKEAKENFIYLPDTDSDVIEEMLLFFYKNKLSTTKKDYKIALKLFKFADMYQIDKLKATCEFILINNLTIDNVFTIHNQGIVCNSVILQQHTITFISCNSNKIIVAIRNNESWEPKNDNLDAEINKNKLDLKHKFEFTQNNERLNSPEKKIDGIPNITFWIEAKLNNNKNRAEIIVKKNCCKESVAVIKVLGYYRGLCYTRVLDWKNNVEFDNNSKKFLCAKDISRNEKSTFSVECSIHWHGFVEDLYNPDLETQMNSFYNNKEFSDMVIKNEKTELPAHKIVIANQSPVFHKMLYSDTKDDQENSIYLSDTDTDMIEELLLFFYRGKLEKAERDYKSALKLLKIADMYRIDKLKSACEYILIKNLTVDNVFTVYDQGKICDSVILQQHAIVFIFENTKELINAAAM